MVFFFGNSEAEAEGLVGAGRNLGQSKGSAAGRGVDESILPGELLPAAVPYPTHSVNNNLSLPSQP